MPWGCYSNPDFFRLLEQDVIFAAETAEGDNTAVQYRNFSLRPIRR